MLAACDVGFVLSYKESASYACYESLALGLPVLISMLAVCRKALSICMKDGWCLAGMCWPLKPMYVTCCARSTVCIQWVSGRGIAQNSVLMRSAFRWIRIKPI